MGFDAEIADFYGLTRFLPGDAGLMKFMMVMTNCLVIYLPFEKYEFVNWDEEPSQSFWKNKIHVLVTTNHSYVNVYQRVNHKPPYSYGFPMGFPTSQRVDSK